MDPGVVERPAVQARLSGVLRYMSVWHALAGAPEDAALAAGLAQATERDFRASPLVHRLILRELDGCGFERRAMRPGDFVEDEAKRRRLRDRFFAGLVEARLQDVARLDLTEVAYWTLELAFERAALDIADGLRERIAHLLASKFLGFGEGPARFIQRREPRSSDFARLQQARRHASTDEVPRRGSGAFARPPAASLGTPSTLRTPSSPMPRRAQPSSSMNLGA